MVNMSPRTAALVTLAALAIPGACARNSQTTPPTTVVVDPQPAQTTPAGDLEILRYRAAMGMTADVRAELTPRIASAGDAAGPDPGRDALRCLAIELALVQGDGEAARTQLERLRRDVTGLGERATPEHRAQLALLHGTWLYDQGKYADARGSHLRALASLDGKAAGSVLVGTALRGLAGDLLALGDATGAVATLERALEIHGNTAGAHIELHEDLLLGVDVMIALKQPDEARILAGQAYEQALKQFGPDTLPHAEALLLVGAASLAADDVSAGASLIADAGEIFDKLQTERSDKGFPVSARAARRLAALRAALARPSGS
jgi:tetratricopeptide (TPR) repeat protein